MFLVEGSVTVPPGASVSFTPLLVFVNDTSGIQSLVLRAPSATLHVFKRSFLEVDGGETYYQHRDGVEHTRILLRDATIRTIDAGRGGFLGMYPEPSAQGRFIPLLAATLQPQDRSQVATQMSLLRLGAKEPERFGQNYNVQIDEPHMDWSAPGTFQYKGAGAVKAYGLELAVESADLSGTFRTGVERDSDFAVRGGAYRWALIEFSVGTMEATSSTPWRLDATHVDARGEGRVVMHKIRHGPEAAPDAHRARRSTEQLEGAFDATLAVQRDAGGLLLTRVDVRQGTLALATAAPLAAQSARVGSPASSWLLPLLGLGVVFATGGAAGAYAVLRSRLRGPSMPFRAEDCREAGAAAASQEEWALAAEWFERGVRLAPTSARMNADLAFALSQIGDHEGALRHYAAASRHSNDGEADFNGALAAIAAGRPPDEVETWLARALQRSPEFVVHMEEDEEFDPLRGRAPYRRIVDAAWREVERRGFQTGG